MDGRIREVGETNMDGSCAQIIAAVIGVLGSIIAADIAVNAGNKISDKIIEKKVYNYSNKNHDVSHIMKLAKKSIYIVACLGDELWKKHKEDFVSYLESGVNIYWLISSEKYFSIINDYIEWGIDKEEREDIINLLSTLQKLKTKGKFFLKVFDNFIASSYIAVDIDVENYKSKIVYSVIHCMPYCYKVEASKSPNVDIFPDENKKVYKALKTSIEKMWESGEFVSISDV